MWQGPRRTPARPPASSAPCSGRGPAWPSSWGGTPKPREHAERLDFGDLVALAARVAREVPLAAEMERQRYKVVLLDEFQDTSHAQLVLFSRLFGDGHAVTAVGDPNQSIYGFRGASAGQLFHFVNEFPVSRRTASQGRRPGSPAPVSYLTTAWRNGRNILAAANLISAPLSAAAAQAGPAGQRIVQRGRGGAAAAAQPGRGAGPGGDGTFCHR